MSTLNDGLFNANDTDPFIQFIDLYNKHILICIVYPSENKITSYISIEDEIHTLSSYILYAKIDNINTLLNQIFDFEINTAKYCNIIDFKGSPFMFDSIHNWVSYTMKYTDKFEFHFNESIQIVKIMIDDISEFKRKRDIKALCNNS